MRWILDHGYITPDGVRVVAHEFEPVDGAPRLGAYDKVRDPDDRERRALDLGGDGWKLYERVRVAAMAEIRSAA